MRLALLGLVITSAIATRARADTPIYGRVTIGRVVFGSVSSYDATAMFQRSPLWGVEIAKDGPCVLRKRTPTENLSAGQIDIAGAPQPIVLSELRRNGELRYTNAPDASFADGTPLTISAAGGADVPAFTASIIAPPAIADYTPPTRLPRSGITLTWAPSSDTQMRFVIGASSSRTHDSVFVICEVPDSGSFTIPATTFALIPPAFDRGNVIAMRFKRTFVGAGDAHVVVEGLALVAGPAVPIADPPRPEKVKRSVEVEAPSPMRHYFEAGWGMGGFSRNGDTPPLGDFGIRFAGGRLIGHGLHIAAEANIVPQTGPESHLLLGAGVRWVFLDRPSYMFGPPRAHGLHVINTMYATASIGVDLRDRVTTMEDTTTASPFLALGLGTDVLAGDSWVIGSEFREQVAYFDGHWQRGWFFPVVVRLGF